MPTEKYIGFYTEGRFWPVAAPDFNLHSPALPNDLNAILSTVVVDERLGDLRVRIARDGMIEIRKESVELDWESLGIGGNADTLIEVWSQYLKLANVFFLLLDMACLKNEKISFFRYQEITRRDVLRLCYDDGKFHSASAGGASTLHGLHARSPSTYQPGLPFSADPRIGFAIVLSRPTIDEALGNFSRVSADHDLLDRVSILAKAVAEYKIGNLSTSIVLCWFVLERLVNEKYERFLESKRSSGSSLIDKERMKFLTGRDFTAAIVSNFLELIGVISSHELVSIDTIRRFRNDVAHDLQKKTLTSLNCSVALSFTASFLLNGIIAEPLPNLSWQCHT